jgi:hypothetical protein
LIPVIMKPAMLNSAGVNLLKSTMISDICYVFL